MVAMRQKLFIYGLLVSLIFSSAGFAQTLVIRTSDSVHHEYVNILKVEEDFVHYILGRDYHKLPLTEIEVFSHATKIEPQSTSGNMGNCVGSLVLAAGIAGVTLQLGMNSISEVGRGVGVIGLGAIMLMSNGPNQGQLDIEWVDLRDKTSDEKREILAEFIG